MEFFPKWKNDVYKKSNMLSNISNIFIIIIILIIIKCSILQQSMTSNDVARWNNLVIFEFKTNISIVYELFSQKKKNVISHSCIGRTKFNNIYIFLILVKNNTYIPILEQIYFTSPCPYLYKKIE